jgi:hypothetical protein
MEVYPNFYIANYENYVEENVIKSKKIKVVIHVGKRKKFIGKEKLEEIRVPIEFNEDDYDLLQINLDLYNYMHDTIEYIHEHLKNNRPVLLLGYGYKQEVDVMVCSFYMRYGKVPPKLAMYYLKTKKKNVFLPECLYEYCLEKYYEEEIDKE